MAHRQVELAHPERFALVEIDGPRMDAVQGAGALHLFHHAVVLRSIQQHDSRPGQGSQRDVLGRIGIRSGEPPVATQPGMVSAVLQVTGVLQRDHGRHKAGSKELLVVTLGQARRQGRLNPGSGPGAGSRSASPGHGAPGRATWCLGLSLAR